MRVSLFLRSKFSLFVLYHSAQRHFTVIPSVYNTYMTSGNLTILLFLNKHIFLKSKICHAPTRPSPLQPSFHFAEIHRKGVCVCTSVTYPPFPTKALVFLSRYIISPRVLSATAARAGGRRRCRGRGFANGVGIIIGRAFFVAADGEVDAAFVGLCDRCGVPEPLDHAFCFWSAFVALLQRGKGEGWGVTSRGGATG